MSVKSSIGQDILSEHSVNLPSMILEWGMSVYLGCCNIVVTQHVLDGFNIRGRFQIPDCGLQRHASGMWGMIRFLLPPALLTLDSQAVWNVVIFPHT